jgi:hypothetical protein
LNLWTCRLQHSQKSTKQNKKQPIKSNNNRTQNKTKTTTTTRKTKTKTLRIPIMKTSAGGRSFSHFYPTSGNVLPTYVMKAETNGILKKRFKTFYLSADRSNYFPASCFYSVIHANGFHIIFLQILDYVKSFSKF